MALYNGIKPQKIKTHVNGSNLELLQEIPRNATFAFVRLSGNDFRQCFQTRQRIREGKSTVIAH